MWTDRRLTQAYEHARVESLESDSRFVFISDCHRGTGNLADEFTRNENTYLFALEQYFRDGYTYVEVGDGDELWEHPQFRHVRNAHFDVFALLRRFHDEGRLIMLWGNHNNYLRSPAYVRENFFSYYHEHGEVTFDFLPGLEPIEALVLEDSDTGQEVFVVHGHQGDFANDQGWFMTMLGLKYFWRHLHAIGITNPASPTTNAAKRHKIERNYNKWIARHCRTLICGHTHRPKYPWARDLPYFNTGSCIYPTSMTAIEIAAGLICLVRWHVVPDEEGTLRVQRQVLRGPDPLEKFDIREAGSTTLEH